jgi:hypothetical protein
VIDRFNCDVVDEHDLVARFVAGRLTEAEAQALEVHCLECEKCWSELRLALKVHAAAEPDGIASTHARAAATAGAAARRPRVWMWAAAAALILAAGASWLLQRNQPPTEIERGGLQLERVNVSVQNGTIVIAWPPVDEASRYVVSVLGPNGHLLAQRETAATRAEFDASAIPVSGALATVEAYSALGDRIATSALTPLPSRSLR